MTEWTTEQPTEPGWYWVWNKELDIVILEVVEGVLVWYPYYDMGPQYDLSSIGTHWMGPIPNPEPPNVSA